MSDVPLLISPDPDDPGCADIGVDGTIGGRPYRFVLDTGAARTQVVADAFTAGAEPLGRIESSGVFRARDQALIRLPDVMVGPIHRRSVEALRVEADALGARNLLAMNVLRHYRCDFSFDEARLRVGGAAPAGTRPLWMDEAGHPYVDVDFPQVAAATVWDTGAGITVVDQGFVGRHPGLFQPAAPSEGIDATGARVRTPTYLMAESSIGGSVFAAHRVAAVDLTPANATLTRPMDMILGYSTLRQANWYFDFPGTAWAITRPPRVAGSSG